MSDPSTVADVSQTLHWDFWTYFLNPYFWSGFMGWCVAQTIKMTRGAIRTKSLDFTYLMSTGGMPSAHSSLVVGIFVSLGIGVGWAAPYTILASVVASITMFDAATVRRAAGLQARLLNKLTRQLFKEHRLSVKPLKEMLGHTRTEVFGGMITGTIVAIVVMFLWDKFGWPGI
ncbi:MAG: divergent PAP2 family protein [Kiritimatiellae bacterium]|nr:divergent PAP2 family protein [Kiritimatiellia bacterium]